MDWIKEEDGNQQVVVVIDPARDSILTDFSVVDGVEENHRTDDHLEDRSDSDALRLAVLVLPSPEAAAHGAHECSRGFVAASQPSGNFADFHLTERSIS